MVSKRIATVVAIIDVLLAAALIIAYNISSSTHITELQLIKGSKKHRIILYVYVSICTLVQLTFAFKFYQSLTKLRDDPEDVEDLLHMSKYWLIASYILLINWVVKAGIYSQVCDCSITPGLAVYLIEIVFRICAICIVNPFITKLEKSVELRERYLRLRSLSQRRAREAEEQNVDGNGN